MSSTVVGGKFFSIGYTQRDWREDKRPPLQWRGQTYSGVTQ